MQNLDNILNSQLGKRTYINKMQFKQDKDFLNKFCKKYDLSLIKVITTYETGKSENMYFFNDNFGGYTLDGIKKSLS